MKIINGLRNIVAHNKIMNKNDYDLLLKLLKENIEIINQAISVTESVDFAILNRNKRIEAIEKFRNIVIQAISDINSSIYSKTYEKIANILIDTSNNKNIYDKAEKKLMK